MGVFRIVGTSGPFEVGQSVIAAKFVEVIYHYVVRGRDVEEGQGDEAVGEFWELVTIAAEADMDVAVMGDGTGEDLAGGDIAEATVGRAFVAGEAGDGYPDFGWQEVL